MWEQTNMRERERKLGILFGFTLILVLIFILIWNGSSLAGRVIGVGILGVLCFMLVRGMLAVRRLKGKRAETGPLSPDERSKALSRLVKRK